MQKSTAITRTTGQEGNSSKENLSAKDAEQGLGLEKQICSMAGTGPAKVKNITIWDSISCHPGVRDAGGCVCLAACVGHTMAPRKGLDCVLLLMSPPFQIFKTFILQGCPGCA